MKEHKKFLRFNHKYEKEEGVVMKKRGLLFLIFALVLVLSACTTAKQSGGGSDKGKDGDGEKAGEKNYLLVNNGDEPTTLNPPGGFNDVSWGPLNNLMEGLTRLNKESNPEEATAEKIEVSEDGTEYTFTIRDGAKWSNGDDVKASDFVYSWLYMLDPETASEAAFLAYNIKGAEEYNSGTGTKEDVAIKAEDDRTFVVTLNEPTEAFLSIITNPNFSPINEKVATENPKWHTEASSYVSNGPFKLVAWDHDVQLVMEPNEHYWDKDKVKLDGIKWAMVNEAATSYQMYQTGELDISGIPSENAEELMKSDEAVFGDIAGIEFYIFNVNQAPFTNKNIRKALSMAIDREEIVQYITKNGEKPAHGFVPYGFIGPNGKDFREESGDLVTKNEELAKELLAKGMEEEGYDELPPIEITYNTAESHKKKVEAMQDSFKKVLGIDVQMQNVELAVFVSERRAKKYQFARFSFLHDYADPINALENFITNSSMNQTEWSNAEYDQLIADAKNETDAQKRWDIMLEAEKLLIDESILIPLHFYTRSTLEKPNVSGILRHPVGYIDFKYAEKK